MQKSSISTPLGFTGNTLCGLLLLLLSSIIVGACRSPEPVAEARYRPCGEDGHLTTNLFGALEVSLDWHPDVLECNGMPRPNNEGARLHFAGPAQNGSAKRSLTFILAMPDLQRGEAVAELPTNVTMIEEGTGRFFGTQDTENCWTDIQFHDQVGNPEKAEYRISGILYCVAPLAQLNGNADVSFAELNFTGRINWNIPK